MPIDFSNSDKGGKMVEQDMSFRDLRVGTKTAEKLTAAKCAVLGSLTEYVEKAKINKAVFLLKHPEKEDPVKISSATILRQKKDKKEIVSQGLWVKIVKEDDGSSSLDKDCVLSKVLQHYSAANMKAMDGLSVETETDSEGYLTIKAY